MSIAVVTQFRAKPGRSGELLALVFELFPPKKQPEGCIAIQVRQNQHDENDIVVEQQWHSRQQAERWRAAPTALTAIRTLITEPLCVRYFETVDPAFEAHPAALPAERDGVGRAAPPEVPTVSTPDALGG